MKKCLLTLLVFAICINVSLAQPFGNDDEKPTYLHLITGFSNYSGDLKLEKYSFNQSKPLFGLGLQKYLTNKLSLRGEAAYTTVSGDDRLSGEKYRLKRNLNFTTHVLEGSLLVQYDWFGLDNEKSITPYLFAGGGYFHYNPYTHDANGNEVSIVAENKEGANYQLSQFNLAMGAGLKWKMSDNFQIAAELNSKILFTDYLDGVSKRGNTKNKDNYYYMALHFSINLAAFGSGGISY